MLSNKGSHMPSLTNSRKRNARHSERQLTGTPADWSCLSEHMY